MKKETKIILSITGAVIVIALLLTAIAIAALALFLFPVKIETKSISNFEECVSAGNPVMESYPRQCRANEQTFTEAIPESEKTYVSRDREECTLIKFQCEQGKTPFFDDIGCGCQTSSKEIPCSAESRDAEVCTMIYAPVCGYFNPEKIQCIKYPCAETFSNPCVACSNHNVDYYIEGECSN